ncbi:glycosyltransferase family 4 protein [Oceanirhabdus seepicola]|uniref:Glycosyltransferase family 4 protein n=1 Tax=Oceanirhabdus seepicola TaxID=2828781 RepID=A0A9J6P2I7_9CLOT|nr:glycosyltransferase family 4 protein [Oceanirhabdus seepicola]MCM1990273.1 glycosyltransferase family 4 protein [Oceanirhabdus seepicola]
MKGNVCIFVLNDFINDARVRREASSLVEAGYKVKVVCVYTQFSSGLKKDEIMDGFKVRRVNKYSDLALNIRNYRNKLRSEYKNAKNIKQNNITNIILLTIYLLLEFISIILKKTKILKLVGIFNVIIRMIKEGLKEEFDIYHSNDLNTLPQGYICSKLFKKKKLIYDSHEVQTSRTGNIGKKRYSLIEKFLIRKTDKMIMTTDTRAQYTADLYKIKKPEIIHNYPFIKEKDLSKFNLYEIANIPKDEPILLYQGGIQEGRGLEKIIEAIPKFKKGITVFIGDGKLKDEIINMVESKGLMERVRFLSKVPAKDLMYFTQHAYLGFQVLQNICFNHYSSLSNKLLEYAMMEVPMVASNFPEMKKIVEDNQIGKCVDPHDSNNIAEAVNYLLNNRDKYIEFKLNCKQARLRYNWENEKKNFIRIYDNLLNSE